MSGWHGAGLVIGVALAGGLVTAAAFGPQDGLLLAALLLGSGVPILALSHLLARRRARVGSLSRQFALAIALVVGLALASVAVVAGLMFVSTHDAVILMLLLVSAGVLAVYSASILAREVMWDIGVVAQGVTAVGHGARDVRLETRAADEVAELAAAGNRMIEQLAAREAERDAAEAARRSLLAAVSHDLRTPLASLRVLVEALGGEEEALDEETRRRYLGQLAVHVASLEGLIDDLFELSRLEAGEIEWPMEELRLGELVEETVEAMGARSDAEGVVSEVRLEAELPLVRGNPEKLQRVLFNLIDNAIRHTPEGGRIVVAAEGAAGGGVEVEVADSGEGIDAAEREQVFDPFYRGGRESPRTRRGAGLGLTICRKILEVHGGRVWVGESRSGARVRFSVPGAHGEPA